MRRLGKRSTGRQMARLLRASREPAERRGEIGLKPRSPVSLGAPRPEFPARIGCHTGVQPARPFSRLGDLEPGELGKLCGERRNGVRAVPPTLTLGSMALHVIRSALLNAR